MDNSDKKFKYNEDSSLPENEVFEKYQYILDSLNTFSDEKVEQLADFILLENIQVISGKEGVNPIINNVSKEKLLNNIKDYKEKLNDLNDLNLNIEVKSAGVKTLLGKMNLFTGISKESLEGFITYSDLLLTKKPDDFRTKEGEERIKETSVHIADRFKSVFGEQ